MSTVFTYISQGHGEDDERRKEWCQNWIKWVLRQERRRWEMKETESGIKKKVSMGRDEPGINNLVFLVGLRRGEWVSGAWGQQTASFLPARQHGDRKGHQGRSLGQRLTSCQGRQGSGDKYIRVAGGATCLWLSPSVFSPPWVTMLTSMAARWEIDTARGGWVWEREGVRALGVRWHHSVSSVPQLGVWRRQISLGVKYKDWQLSNIYIWQKRGKKLSPNSLCFLLTAFFTKKICSAARKRQWQASYVAAFVCYNLSSLGFWWHPSPLFIWFRPSHAIFRRALQMATFFLKVYFLKPF